MRCVTDDLLFHSEATPPGGLRTGRVVFVWPSLVADIGYESLINLMLKDLFKLLVSCVSEPAETISRVGCSCIR